MHYTFNEYEQPLVVWLKEHELDVLTDCLARMPFYPKDWDLIDVVDDNYPDVYNYYCERREP